MDKERAEPCYSCRTGPVAPQTASLSTGHPPGILHFFAKNSNSCLDPLIRMHLPAFKIGSPPA